MNVIATTLKHLIAAGVTGDALVTAINDIEEAQKPIRSSSAERQKRYRERNALRNIVTNVTPPFDGFNGFPHPSLTSLNPPKENTPKGVQKKIPNENFEAFWEAFPRTRRGNKQKAEAAYRQALSRCSADEITSGLTAYVDSAEVANGFAKGAAAWLNDDRWGSDYSIVIQSQTIKSFDQQNKDKTDLAVAEARKKYANPS